MPGQSYEPSRFTYADPRIASEQRLIAHPDPRGRPDMGDRGRPRRDADFAPAFDDSDGTYVPGIDGGTDPYSQTAPYPQPASYPQPAMHPQPPMHQQPPVHQQSPMHQQPARTRTQVPFQQPAPHQQTAGARTQAPHPPAAGPSRVDNLCYETAALDLDDNNGDESSEAFYESSNNIGFDVGSSQGLPGPPRSRAHRHGPAERGHAFRHTERSHPDARHEGNAATSRHHGHTSHRSEHKTSRREGSKSKDHKPPRSIYPRLGEEKGTGRTVVVTRGGNKTHDLLDGLGSLAAGDPGPLRDGLRQQKEREKAIAIKKERLEREQYEARKVANQEAREREQRHAEHKARKAVHAEHRQQNDILAQARFIQSQRSEPKEKHREEERKETREEKDKSVRK